jgi:acetoin utilization deacetylase AcuC-like enzyme
MVVGAIRRTWRWLLNRALGSSTRFIHGPHYGVRLLDSRFDAQRARRILSFLLEEHLVERRFVQRVPHPASARRLRSVHTDDYLESLDEPDALTGILGFRVTPEEHDAYLLSHREQVAGTVWACRAALASGGVAVNLGGGFHHALADRGQGFCVFNDVAIAVVERRSRGFDAPILVIDLDLHDGDGTRGIFSDDPTVHTLSIHNQDLGSTDAVASTSLALGSGVEDSTYLQALRETLSPVIERFRPGLAIYLAGCDPARDDRLGDWRITPGALLERDRYVVDLLRDAQRSVPLVIVLAGGYGQESWRYSARFLSTLLRSGTPVEPPETGSLRLRWLRKTTELLGPGDLTVEPSDSWQLTEADVDPSAAGRARRTRFLDYYSRHGIELGLERTGLLESLRARGHRALRLELDLDHPHEQMLRLRSDDAEGESLIELRARRDTTTISGRTLLRIEWLLLQDPLARFTADRPALPGQRHPGLGLLGEVSAILVLMCERLKLDGIGFVPSHFHIAAQARSYFHFVDPEAQARFLALRKTLEAERLSDATVALEEGRVIDLVAGEPTHWQPSAMVHPVSAGMKEALDNEDYRRAVDAFAGKFRFELIRKPEGGGSPLP